MKDTTKATKRRSQESGFWTGVLGGYGIDVGYGNDPLAAASVHFDKQNGDANKLSQYFGKEEFHFLHASHCLEHMDNPYIALGDWYKLIKPDGYLIIIVPDWCLYEGMIWPSRYNPDHKSTWSLWLPDSPAPFHVKIRDLAQFYNVIYAHLIDTDYDYKVGTIVDQTLDPRVEAAIEFIIKKK